jgi:hypothetical protein
MKTLILSLVLICAVGIARAQLTPDEQTFAKGLDPAAQTKYTATREYFHRAAAIINKTAEPTTLGRKPQEFDAQYLKPDEAATITKARDLSNIELMKGISIAAPASSGLPAAQGVLTSDEENYAKGLNAVDRERYQATREYVHKAVAIVNKTADPASFGLRPKTYDTKYLKSDEAKIVRQAREMSNTALLKGIKIK